MSESVMAKLGLVSTSTPAKTSFDGIASKMRAQQKRIIQAEGDEHKAKIALDAAHDALTQEREALQAMAREFYNLAREEGFKAEEPK